MVEMAPDLPLTVGSCIPSRGMVESRPKLVACDTKSERIVYIVGAVIRKRKSRIMGQLVVTSRN